MTRKRRGFVAILFTLATIWMSANSADAAGIHQVPFRGAYLGTAAFTSPTTAHFSGIGISTHLGLGTNEGTIYITATDGSCPGGLANGFVNDNYETLTAANGDTLMLVSHDVGCPTGVNMFHGTGHWEVTGGTGRFSGATGTGTADGHADFNLGRYSFQLTGTISIPNGP